MPNRFLKIGEARYRSICPRRDCDGWDVRGYSTFPKIKPTKINQSLFGRSVNAVQVEHTRASRFRVRQGDVKQAGADLLVAPVQLNVRLPCPEPAQRRAVTPFVKRRNLKIHVAVNVGGDLGGDVTAAQLAQRGLDSGGQRGLALVVDGGTAEGGNLCDICGSGLDMHAAAD